MNIIEAKIRKIEAFDQDIDFILVGLMTDEEDLILELNRAQMQDKGIRGDGSKITPTYAAFTIAKKKKDGDEYRFVTLRDTGEFFDDMFLDVYDDRIIIASENIKTADLVTKYGSDIFGLIDSHLQELINTIKPGLIETLRNNL